MNPPCLSTRLSIRHLAERLVLRRLAGYGKYWQVFKLTWEEYLAYRLNFFMWRVRTVLQLLTIYFLWLAILRGRGEIFGWSQSSILTYILGTSILRAIIFSTRTYEVGSEINEGNLLNFLLRPINYFKYWFSKDLADKVLNIGFSIVELTLIFLILRPPIFWQTNIAFLALFVLAVGLGVILNFFVSLSLSSLAFWTPDIWGIRFLFGIILEFFAGALFPLDILPKTLFSLLQFLPFSYLLYFPLKIYLGTASFGQILTGFVVEILWLVIIFQVLQIVWQKGLRIYGAWGR